MARRRVPVAVSVRGIAAKAVIPVFVARGLGANRAAAELRGQRGLRIVDSPRRAVVLVATGTFPGALDSALTRVHDQMPHPRGSVWWRSPDGQAVPAALRDAQVVHALDDVGTAALDVYRRCVLDVESSNDVANDVPPNPFEGLGENGQGGEGMMGGVPYGRPMAMTAPDRDGLELDRWNVTFGPFGPWMPPGVVVRAALQGGVVQELAFDLIDAQDASTIDPAAEHANEAVQFVRTRLRIVSDLCAAGGLDSLATRAALLAARPVAVQRGDIDRLERALRRSGAMRWWSGVGILHQQCESSDVASRTGLLLDDCRALLLGQSDRTRSGRQTVPVVDQLAAAAAGLVGADWSDVMVTLASMDLPDVGARREEQVCDD